MSTPNDRLPMLGEFAARVELSPAGEARRAAMRTHLERAVRARGHRRTATRGAAVVAALAVLASAAVLVRAPAHTADPALPPIAQLDAGTEADRPAPADIAAAPLARAFTPAPTVHRLVGYIKNDASALVRFSASPGPSRVEVLDDDALLRSLDEAGLPAGLVRTPDRVRLAFHQAGPGDPTP